MLSHPTCAPEWYNKGVHCPYGIVPLDDYGLDPLHVSTWTWPHHHDPLPVYVLAGFYSCLELVMGYGLIFFVFGCSTASLVFFVAYWGYKVPIGKILKQFFLLPRPVGSCLPTCGMPSGHSTYALMFFTLGVLLLLTRVKPPSAKHVAGSIALLAAVLLPMPWSRVQLGDHSVEQVVWGSLTGMTLGIIFFIILHLPSVQYLIKSLRHLGLRDNLTTFWGGSRLDQREGKETQALRS